MAAEGITDRGAQPGGMGSAELEVVADKVEMSLRPDEDAMTGVYLNSTSYMPEEMIRADKVCAGEKIAGDKVLVEAHALPAEPGLQFRRGFLSQRWSKHSVKVVENRTKGQKSLGETSCGPPGDLAANPEIMKEEEVAAETRKHASAYRLRKEVAGSIERGGRRYCAEPKGYIQLLRISSRAHQEEKHA